MSFNVWHWSILRVWFLLGGMGTNTPRIPRVGSAPPSSFWRSLAELCLPCLQESLSSLLLASLSLAGSAALGALYMAPGLLAPEVREARVNGMHYTHACLLGFFRKTFLVLSVVT